MTILEYPIERQIQAPTLIMTKQKQQKLTVNDLRTPDAEKRKALVSYLVASIIITIPAGMISIINLNAYFPAFLVIAGQLIVFLGLGLVHTSVLKKNIAFPGQFRLNNKLIFSVLIALLISFVLVILYLVKGGNTMRMAYASSCSFLLPFIVQQVWETLAKIPKKEFTIWYNSDGVIDSRTTIFLNSVPIRLRLAMKYFDIEEEVFELTVPGHTQFGKFFNQFIIEKNRSNVAIECVDMEKKPFGWQFYAERFWGLYKQIIDPELSLRENKVRDHSTITAKRKREVLQPAKENPEAAEWKALPKLKQTKPINKHEAKK